MSRQFLQPGDQLLDEHFTDERLKTALAWLGAHYAGPKGALVGAALGAVLFGLVALVFAYRGISRLERAATRS